MASKTKAETSPQPRLDIEAWTNAALDLLAERGIDGVRVELLARKLGVTKGSFYWHFKARDDLLAAMLVRWKRRATLDLIRWLDRDRQPDDRLKRLMRLPFAGAKSSHAADVELAIRLWGRRDSRALAALEEVDELRVAYIAQLIEACGISSSQARARAILGYSYIRVAGTLIAPRDVDLMALCEDVLLQPAAG